MPEEFDPEQFDVPEDPYRVQGGTARTAKKPDKPGGLSVDSVKGKGVKQAANVLSGGKLGVAEKIPVLNKIADELSKKAAQLISKNFWRSVIIANWPTLLTIGIVIILILFCTVPAFARISASRRGVDGKRLNEPISLYSSSDREILLAQAERNAGGLVFPSTVYTIGNQGSGSEWRSSNRPNHRGIDRGLPIGTAYYASASGVVVYLKDDIADHAASENRFSNGGSENGGFGNTIIIQITEGNWKGYFFEIHHLKQGSATALGLATGSRVVQNQPIGASGHNGISSAPHIHFQIDRPGGGCEARIKGEGRPCNITSDTINPRIPLGWL